MGREGASSPMGDHIVLRGGSIARALGAALALHGACVHGPSVGEAAWVSSDVENNSKKLNPIRVLLRTAHEDTISST